MVRKRWETGLMNSAPYPDLFSLVAVPIGNIGDLSARAAECLSAADVIFCEDTRKTSDLLKRATLITKAKLVPVPGDSEFDTDWKRYCSPSIRRWALVSDAGTPIVNDPGVSLLAFCRKHQIPTEALPGPSAPIAAWQWSGGFGLPFVFAGFAPKVSQSSSAKWQRFMPTCFNAGTFCFFDTRHQILNTLKHFSDSFPESELYIAREITKAHQELLFGKPAFLLEKMHSLVEADHVGELCLLVNLSSLGLNDQSALAPTVDELIKFRVAPTKDASKLLAKWSELSSQQAYKRLCDES
jgi:16S rRNA (cytidine1402-2'-O)-methyltransferase